MRVLAASVVAGLGAAVIAQPPASPTVAAASKPALSGCRTAQGSVHFDFEGASRSTCQVVDANTISILVTPEHLPPINPSPWYAFRYTTADGGKLNVTVRYLGAKHRYAPQWRGKGNLADFAVVVAADGSAVSLTLPPGDGIVSAQPLLTASYYDKQLKELAESGKGQRIVLGHSLDGRPVEAVRLGSANAPRLIVLLGRQHPPEVTGAVAMDTFTRTLATMIGSGKIDSSQFQFLIVPLLNPDGVARGHWRANLGGVDLNRDWGVFSQPETRAVGDWLAKLPTSVKPVLMLDFHSTNRNVFYVQGSEASEQGRQFRDAWLGGKEAALAGYRFTIDQRDANPGSGTAKNWFNSAYGIPAYTYEVADDADLAAVRSSAETLAQTLIPALSHPLPAAAPARAGDCPELAAGSSQIEFSGWAGPKLPVYLHKPRAAKADSRIVFVMHGVNRDGDRYRDEWRDLAEQHGLIVVVPTFGRKDFPTTESYNLGNIFDREGQRNPPSQWSFSAIEPLFDEIVCRLGGTQRGYALYGHSAGGQFVHRFVAFAEAPRLEAAVSANSGWYTMPSDAAFPYGWGGAAAGLVSPRTAFRRPLTIMLGTADTDRADPNLRTTAEADAQGLTRLARGQAFFAAAQAQTDATSLFGWRIAYAPGVGHDNGKMAPFAIPHLAATDGSIP